MLHSMNTDTTSQSARNLAAVRHAGECLRAVRSLDVDAVDSPFVQTFVLDGRAVVALAHERGVVLADALDNAADDVHYEDPATARILSRAAGALWELADTLGMESCYSVAPLDMVTAVFSTAEPNDNDPTLSATIDRLVLEV